MEMHLPCSNMLHRLYTTYLQGMWTMFEAWNLVDGKEALLLFAPGFRKWNRFCDLLCKIMIYVLSKRDRECDSEWEGQEGKAIERGPGPDPREQNMTQDQYDDDDSDGRFSVARLRGTVFHSPLQPDRTLLSI